MSLQYFVTEFCLYFLVKGVLQNYNVKCLDECGKKQGPCSFCGTGMCCRKGWHDSSNGCDQSLGISREDHTCVASPGTSIPKIF